MSGIVPKSLLHFFLGGGDYRPFLCLAFLRRFLGFQHWECIILYFEIDLLQRTAVSLERLEGRCGWGKRGAQ